MIFNVFVNILTFFIFLSFFIFVLFYVFKLLYKHFLTPGTFWGKSRFVDFLEVFDLKNYKK